MNIYNKSKNIILATNCKRASSFKDNLLGLTKYNKPIPMLFTTRFGIHTFGMKHPIDVIILDSNHIVSSMKINLNSNRIYVWNPSHSIVLELPMDTIQKTKTSIGDRLIIN